MNYIFKRHAKPYPGKIASIIATAGVLFLAVVVFGPALVTVVSNEFFSDKNGSSRSCVSSAVDSPDVCARPLNHLTN